MHFSAALPNLMVEKELQWLLILSSACKDPAILSMVFGEKYLWCQRAPTSSGNSSTNEAEFLLLDAFSFPCSTP